ncbi:YsnF/AvaK domain-containing protein [Pseudoduganella namucuonensis]|uniref:Conserved domain-containing protein n=1 Tax=Pseudoduganella namucuonensis TaxID=1035707 RepID=A0A1I7FTS3_9BURK|nr:YsnF/AvaK domain-containing protein [Pseudoduganella namucuonensis]SFU39571.1 conserved domain-containing protein [Pseudoduganella namucuonensis]
MTHTLAAVFDNRSDAERARTDLIGSGFNNTALSDSSADGASASAGATAAAPRDESLGDRIGNFFSNLFGDEDDERRVYEEAVHRGKAVLTVQADSEDEIERAADIVERYGPVDIDEYQNEWRASGWSGAETPRSGAQNLQGSAASQGAMQSASQQGGASAQGSMQYAAGAASQTIPVVEEALKVGKRIVQRGGLRIHQRVVSTPVSENVSLREEHVNVERHAVDRPVDPASVDAFQENTIELREMAEEAVVQKTARVVEEVVVSKDATQRQDQINETVRRTEVEVEQLGADDADADQYFRSHWTSNYAGSGGGYDDYAPAYRYGATMRSSSPDRSWDEAEPTLRSSWESSYPQSAWEKFKAAVRHGWDRVTS